jgi:hypothetical protein
MSPMKTSASDTDSDERRGFRMLHLWDGSGSVIGQFPEDHPCMTASKKDVNKDLNINH